MGISDEIDNGTMAIDEATILEFKVTISREEFSEINVSHPNFVR